MIAVTWILIALASGLNACHAADEVADGPWTWTTTEGESFRAAPLAQAYDSELQELVFIFTDEKGAEKKVPRSLLAEGEPARFATYQREHRRLEAQRVAAEEAKAKQLAEDRARAEAEREREEQRQHQAAMEQRLFTLKDGGQVTGKRINDFNDQQRAEMVIFLPKLSDTQRQKFNVGVQNFVPIIAATRACNEAKVLEAMHGLYTYNPAAVQAVDWMLTNTPAGTTVIPCDDGRAVEWNAAWKSAAGAYAKWIAQQQASR